MLAIAHAFLLLAPLFQNEGGIRLIRTGTATQTFDKKLEIDLCASGSVLWTELPNQVTQGGEWSDVYIYDPPRSERTGQWKVAAEQGGDVLLLSFKDDTLSYRMHWLGGDVLQLDDVMFRTSEKSEYCLARDQ